MKNDWPDESRYEQIAGEWIYSLNKNAPQLAEVHKLTEGMN
jgi:hypothetical protein